MFLHYEVIYQIIVVNGRLSLVLFSLNMVSEDHFFLRLLRGDVFISRHNYMSVLIVHHMSDRLYIYISANWLPEQHITFNFVCVPKN